MRKGQIFSTDLLISFIVVVAFVGLVVQAFEIHGQHTASSVHGSKMQHLAMDAAALQHYNGSWAGLDASASNIGYIIGNETELPESAACTVGVRGTGGSPIRVYVFEATP